MRMRMRRDESGGAAAPHVRPGFPTEYRRRRGRSDRRALCSRRRRPPSTAAGPRGRDPGALNTRGFAPSDVPLTTPRATCSRAASSRAPQMEPLQPKDAGAERDRMGLPFGVGRWGFGVQEWTEPGVVARLPGASYAIVNGVTKFAKGRQIAARDGPFWDGRWLGMARFLAVVDR